VCVPSKSYAFRDNWGNRKLCVRFQTSIKCLQQLVVMMNFCLLFSSVECWTWQPRLTYSLVGHIYLWCGLPITWNFHVNITFSFPVFCSSDYFDFIVNKKFWKELITYLRHSRSHITTDGQPASLSWNKAPIWGLQPDLDYCLTVAGLLIWGALSNERTGLPFAIATGPRQRSHFRARVP
jgi:hypothetical protein